MMISTSGPSIFGHVEVVQILDDTAPINIGGGGVATKKPVEVEVYTSGNNGNKVNLFINWNLFEFLFYFKEF